MTQYRLLWSPDWLVLVAQNEDSSLTVAQLPLKGQHAHSNIPLLPSLPGVKVANLEQIHSICHEMFNGAVTIKNFKSSYTRFIHWLEKEREHSLTLSNTIPKPTGFRPIMDEWGYQFIIINNILQGEYLYGTG